MDYLLRHALNESDIEFLNETTMEFEIVNTHGLKPETVVDSGWCDAAGSRIIGHRDRAVFKNVSDAEATYLKLRFHDRLNELHDGLRAIYNIR